MTLPTAGKGGKGGGGEGTFVQTTELHFHFHSVLFSFLF